MRLFESKKGQEVTTSKVFYWLIGILVAIWLVFSLWGFGATFFDSLTTTPKQLREDLFVARLTNTCFAWTEQTTSQQAETHPSIIDLSLVTDTRISECFVGEDILPIAIVDVRPLPSQPQSFTSQRAALFDTTLSLSLQQTIQTKTPQPLQERYVLVKNTTRVTVCGLHQDALALANKQQDNLFTQPVLLSEEDFKAIELYIDDLQQVTNQILLRGYSTTQDIFPTLQLTASSNKYRAQPQLDDFCYTKTGDCTYQDFLADYKGNCRVDVIDGNLIPAELRVTFYD